MNGMIQVLIIAIFIAVCNIGILSGQEYLNLDFESSDLRNNTPTEWYTAGSEYKITLDSVEKYNGLRSLKMESFNQVSNKFGVASIRVPGDPSKHKQVKFKGKIRTESIRQGYAGLWMRIEGREGEVNFDNMADRGFDGTHDWTKAEIILDIDTSAIAIYFGALFSGFGTAWFDDFEIFIDGEKYDDKKPLMAEPTEEELKWLKKQILPLSSFDADFESTEDLKELDRLLGDSEVIALGESSHGSSEIFKMKHRIIKYLTQKKCNNIFSIEANMPESYKLNEFTEDGKGSATELIKGMYFWTWRTEEMLDMVHWMKDQNEGKNKIRYSGFDMQNDYGPLEELRSAFQQELGISDMLLQIEIVLDGVKASRRVNGIRTLSDENRRTFYSSLDSIKLHIDKKVKSKLKKDWLNQNCRILEQILLNNSSVSRDKFMAENVMWIKNHNADARIYIWAHNEHIKKTEQRMGNVLIDKLADDYVSIGFTFYSGKYTAIGNKGRKCYDAQEAYLGTYEYLFNKLEEPIFVLDLREIKEEKSAFSEGFLNNLKFRRVGAMKQVNEFERTDIFKDYDLMIFIKESTCSTILK